MTLPIWAGTFAVFGAVATSLWRDRRHPRQPPEPRKVPAEDRELEPDGPVRT